MYNGKLCASTTRYNDQTKAACGCGTSDPVPSDWWTLTAFTAALNCKNLDSSDPLLAWCPTGCGGCYRLCTTGGTTQGYPTVPDKCHVFKITNRCGDGFGTVGGGGYGNDWCSNRLSWKECLEDPEKCMEEGSTNWFGYSAHFDLQDFSHQIKDLQWDNVEVTFERVPCNKSWHGPSWDCSCPASNETLPRPPVTEDISLPSMNPGTNTHGGRSEAWSIFDSALTVLERHADEAAAMSTTIETSSTLKVEAQNLQTATTGLRRTTTSASNSRLSTGPDFLSESGTVLNDGTPTGLGAAGAIEPSVPNAMMRQEERIVLKPEGLAAGEEADDEAENEQEMQEKEKGEDKDEEKEDNLEVKEKENEDKFYEEGEARDNCAGAFQQCGGRAWSGPTCCQRGCSCSGGNNVFYRQCIPPTGLFSCSESHRFANGSDSPLVSFVGRGGTEITGPAAAAVQTVGSRVVPEEASWILDASNHGIPGNQPVAGDSPDTRFSWTWIRISTLANWQVLALLCALLGAVAVGISNYGLRRWYRGGRSRLSAEHSDDHEATTPCSDALRNFLSPLWSGCWTLRNASGDSQRLPATSREVIQVEIA